MKSELKTYLRAGYAALYCIGHEEDRIANEITAVAKELKLPTKDGTKEGFDVWTWTCTAGLVNEEGKAIDKTADPLAALGAFIDHHVMMDGETQGKLIQNGAVIILKDFHLFMKGGNPVLIRRMREAITVGRRSNRHIVIIGCQLNLPPELEKDITVIEFSLPSREELKVVAEQIAQSANQDLNGNTEPILDAGSGLTTTEFADACAWAVVATGQLDPIHISRIKADTIKKNGILEIVTAKVSLDDIGGLDLLKADLHAKRNLFTKAAKEYGLSTPRPLLCVGQPGTGKSLTAMSTQAVFGLPLLRLEASRLFGSLVGESERNWRTAFATAKAVAPCIVWVDEVDGLFSNAESSGRTDGGTTSRVIKTILQDLQFNSEGLFFVFTANDIDGLPDPLIDRCDVWNVELPNEAEREAIWAVHIIKRGRKPENFNLNELAMESEGYSGRQIEQAWLSAMTIAFNDGAREPKGDDCIAALDGMVATSVTMADAIERRRKRLAHCARPASSQVSTKAVNIRKIV